MNAKLLSTLLVAGAVLTTSTLTVSANESVDGFDGDQRPGMHKNFDGQKGQFKKHRKGFMKNVVADLDEETQAALKSMKEAHKAEMQALKDQYGDDKEAMKGAAKSLRESHMEAVKSVLPAEAVAELEAQKAEKKAEIEAKREERRAAKAEKRQERISNLSSKLDTIAEKENATEIFTRIAEKVQNHITKLEEKAASIEENGQLLDTIEMLQDLLNDVNARL